jgi:catechol 2,3-dioxygenase-like lactoylglutathione lyase family enzyme
MQLQASGAVLCVSVVMTVSVGIVLTKAQTSVGSGGGSRMVHFHHVHINSTDPDASIAFYTSKFDCEKAAGPDGHDAIFAQKSWVLFNRVAKQPPSEILSGIWHIGWGAEDMPATYQKQLDAGTRFATPLTDISDLAGLARGRFFYAYVDGPNHELIELNTASNHRFGHLHLLSADPIRAAEWYHEHLGLPIVGKQEQKRIYNGFQVAPSATLQADNVRIIIYPLEYARTEWPALWSERKEFEPSKGRVIDHIAFSREGGKTEFIEGPDRVRIELWGEH